MNHWIVVPVVLPAMMAPFIVLTTRHDLLLQRTFSAAATLALLAVSIALTVAAAGNPPELYALGNWPAPFGIVLVLDRLAALMVLLTRSEEHTSELQSLMRISYAVFCLKKKKYKQNKVNIQTHSEASKQNSDQQRQ